MKPSLNVAVVGAGVAGLAAARELRREAHRVVVYEKATQLGGTWVYDPRVESDPLGLDPERETVQSSLYKSLQTNLPRQLMGFSDYPFNVTRNGELSDFPRHEEVLEFLSNFAREFGLVELIRFGSEVVRVERVELRNDLWVVESRTNGLSSDEEFDAVVVCNGHHTKPKVANIPGIEEWPGKQIHSHNYRIPDPFTRKVVVVIGYGPSAHDIAAEVATAAKEVHISSRSREYEVTMNSTNIWQHPEIEEVYANGEVAFKDGASVVADIILHCTGYKFEFPFLETNQIVTVDDNRVGPLYKHIFPPELAPRLSFVGIPHRVVIFMMMELQAKWVAHVLSSKVVLPSKEEMLADVEAHYRLMEQSGIPKHHTHKLISGFQYLDWLAGQVGLQPPDTKLKQIYYGVVQIVTSGWTGYKELRVDELTLPDLSVAATSIW